MSIEQSDIERISKVQDKYSESLLKMPNVIGTAIGLKTVKDEPTENLALVVMVRKKVPLETLKENERIPAVLDGVVVDVEEISDVFAGL